MLNAEYDPSSENKDADQLEAKYTLREQNKNAC